MGSAAYLLPLVLAILSVQHSCGHAAASPPLELGQLASERGPITNGAEEVLAKMRAQPDDARVQTEGCKGFTMFLGMGNVASLATLHLNPLLTRDNVNTLADAIIRHPDDMELVYACFTAMQGYGATFNKPITLALNNGTRIPEALNKVLKLHALDKTIQKDFLTEVAGFATCVACDAQPGYVRAGCLDRIFDALDNFPSPEDSDVQMSVWQGFSDHSFCPLGAEYISNYGGKNVGARRVAEALHKAKGNHFHPDAMHGGPIINIQYEIITVAAGLLEFANETNGRREVFADAGFHRAVLDSMRDMPDERSTNDRACYALHVATTGSPSLQKEVIEGGGLELIAAAMDRYKGPDHRIFINMDVTTFAPVIPTCTVALNTLVESRPAAQDRLLGLGVLDTYATAHPSVIQAEYNDEPLPDVPGLLKARAAAAGVA